MISRMTRVESERNKHLAIRQHSRKVIHVLFLLCLCFVCFVFKVCQTVIIYSFYILVF